MTERLDISNEEKDGRDECLHPLGHLDGDPVS